MTAVARPSKHTLSYAIRQNAPHEVHKAFGVSRETLCQWCVELGLEVPRAKHPGGAKKGQTFDGRRSKRPSRDQWEADCQTHTAKQLQEKYQVSYWTVWNWCKEFSIPVPGGRRKLDPAATEFDASKDQISASRSLPAPDTVPRLAEDRPSYWCQPNIGTLTP